MILGNNDSVSLQSLNVGKLKKQRRQTNFSFLVRPLPHNSQVRGNNKENKSFIIAGSEILNELNIYLLYNINVMNKEKEFNEYRNRMNERLLDTDNKIIKRIYNLDMNAFEDGHLKKDVKELIGLTCSLVLRCDDCVKYHLGKCHELEYNSEEVVEAMSIATLIGGTIVIPHLRKAIEYWDQINTNVSERS